MSLCLKTKNISFMFLCLKNQNMSFMSLCLKAKNMSLCQSTHESLSVKAGMTSRGRRSL